jgi:hypothetical protein
MRDDVAMVGPAWWDLTNDVRELVEREGLQLDAEARALAVAELMLAALGEGVQSLPQPLELP